MRGLPSSYCRAQVYTRLHAFMHTLTYTQTQIHKYKCKHTDTSFTRVQEAIGTGVGRGEEEPFLSA